MMGTKERSFAPLVQVLIYGLVTSSGDLKG
jgi:hypothetical protein